MPEDSSRRIRLDVAYDGTSFCGWQRQKRDPSVQETLETVLSQIHKTPVSVTASGRTDSGVHARQQVIHFDRPPGVTMPPERYVPAANSLLPSTVRVLSSSWVSSDFHARFLARTRVYRYYITFGAAAPPERAAYSWYRRRRPSLRRLNALCRPLLGSHDFTTFTAAGDPSENKVRRIFAASFRPAGDQILFEIAGNAFLWRMVRSLTGTILTLEESQLSLEDLPRQMEDLLASKERGRAGVSAPARGLFLHQVLYEGEYNGYLW